MRRLLRVAAAIYSNGPHNGPRNTSLGMSTLRMDGFAGMYLSNLLPLHSVQSSGAENAGFTETHVSGQPSLWIVSTLFRLPHNYVRA